MKLEFGVGVGVWSLVHTVGCLCQLFLFLYLVSYDRLRVGRGGANNPNIPPHAPMSLYVVHPPCTGPDVGLTPRMYVACMDAESDSEPATDLGAYEYE